MKYILSIIAILFPTLFLSAADVFVSFGENRQTALKLSGTSDTIAYDKEDWKGVMIAIDNLKKDLRAVTGSDRAPISVGTVGKSRIARQHKSLSRQLEGKWEQYIITVEHGRLIILGSDKRGTIYGIYELSRQIGVSPWYWMADAPIKHRDDIYINKGVFTDGEPKVKYRGIFINDEWPSFGTWCSKQFGGINSKAYSHIFELLLRLKANYFWPAMWASRFNEDDPLAPKMADDMGIVMGTSHHEPMMRAHKEYTLRREEVGPWDYSINSERLDRFFSEGLERNKSYENIITIGMRGDGDVAMGEGNDAENIKTLSKVICNQRRIISNVYGKPATEIPQLWAIFTEVQRYYDAGFSVPEDVTLLFCDNNWGYIRRKGRDFERRRKGGLGMYYHIDMNGGPWNDRWINTSTIPKLREQLHLAYASGIDRIWIINVGDLKPKEVPIHFIMDYAWNPEVFRPGDEKKWLEDFSRSIFGNEHSSEIADIISKYSKYNLMRKPEAQYPGLFNIREMELTDSLWNSLVKRCDKLKRQLPDEAADAFFQLVYYPTVASACVAGIYNRSTVGDTLSTMQLMEKDRQLTNFYNDTLSCGKWNGMMLDKHIGYTKWSMPEENKSPLELGFQVGYNIYPLPSAEVSIPAYRYKTNKATKEAKWIFLPDLGRGEGCMGIDNVMATSNLSDEGPTLEYDINISDSGPVTFAIGILPTQDVYPERGLRLGVLFDDGRMQVLDARRGLVDTFGEYTATNLAVSKVLKPLPAPGMLSLNGFVNGKQQPRRNEVFDNIRWLDVTFDTVPGSHVLKLIMIDPEIVIEKIVVNPDNNKYSYGLF